MAQNNNIEKQIRERLNAREIQPSGAAWDRLDAMLSVAEEKKTKRFFGWLYIAAGILVFATVGTFLYNQQSPKENANDAVVVNEKDENTGAMSNPAKDKINETTPSAEAWQKTPQVAENTGKPSHPKTNTGQTAQQKKQTMINQKTAAQNLVTNRFEAQPNQESIAVATPKKEAATQPSPKITANPDTAVASGESASSNSRVRIDASSLLSEVDGELELTFREKVLKTVTKNYKEVKVAVANRNLDK